MPRLRFSREIGQRAQELDNLIVCAAGLNHQPLGKGLAGDATGDLAVHTVDTLEHATAVGAEIAFPIARHDGFQPLRDVAPLGLDLFGERVVRPEVVNSSLSGHKSKIVAAERAVVLARFPLIQLRLDQYDGEKAIRSH